MTTARLVCVVLAVGWLSGAALAQDSTAEPPVPAAAPQAKVVVVGAPDAPAAPLHSSPMPHSVVVSVNGGMVHGEPLRVAINKSVELPLPAQVADIIVGSPDVADVVVRSPTLVFVVGRGPGQTNIIFRDRNGRTIRRIEVDVHIDSDALKDMLRQVLPDETGLQVAAVGDSILLSGTVRSDRAAATARTLARRFVKDEASVVNLLSVSGEQQVLLHVKVAEMQKSVLKELGVSDTLEHMQKIPFLGSASLQSFTTTGSVGLTAASGAYGAMSVMGIGALANNFTLLEQQGLIKTLVEPNLTAVSGETANMLAGGEYPIPVSGANGSISIEFKQFGIALSFTPVVLDAGRISLKLQTEVSAIDNSITVPVGNNVSVPGLSVRRAASVVELPSGGSIMIAGLLQNDMTQTMAGLPGIMDIPVLGSLFRSNSFQHNESELVVIVSTYAVQPISAAQMTLPTDGFAPSSDISRFLFGRLQDIYTRPHPTPEAPPALQGPIGYMVQ